jgi:hypothetical protein
VTVYRKQPGADPKVGRKKSNDSGKYSIRKRKVKAGRYYARVEKTFIAGVGNCLAHNSPTKRVS